jgi:hypothetical protein
MIDEIAPDSRPKDPILKTVVDLIVKIGVLILLIFFCINILSPFANILLWAMIIAIIVFPLYEKLGGYFGKRKKMASIIITVLALAVCIQRALPGGIVEHLPADRWSPGQCAETHPHGQGGQRSHAGDLPRCHRRFHGLWLPGTLPRCHHPVPRIQALPDLVR